MKTVADIKQSVAGLVTGTGLDESGDIDGALERSVREMSQQAYVPEASDYRQFMLFDGVFDYLAPDRIFGSSFVDLRPQGVSRAPFDYAYKVPVATFDRTKCVAPSTGINVTFEWRKGVPIMRLATFNAIPRAILDPMNSTTGWAASGTASGLALDSTVYYEQPASLRFNVAGAGAGILSKTLSSAVDMSSYQGVGTVFVALRINSDADLANFTSLTMRIGSDSSNYSSVTSAQGFLGAIGSERFLLVAFDLSTVTNTGNPNYSSIKYLYAAVNHTGSMSNVRLGYFFASLPLPYELLFKTAAVFLSGTNLSSEITNDSDQIVLNGSAYTILEYQYAVMILLQNGADKTTGLCASYIDTLHNPMRGLYPLYRAENPSQIITTTGNWYED